VERDEAAYAAGVQAAKADIAAGRLVYRWGGHAGHWGHWIVTQFAERFGVGVSDGFGICFVSRSGRSFDDGYNAVLIAEVNRRHGAGTFEAVLAESRQQSEDALWAAKQAWLAQHPDAEPGAADGTMRFDPMNVSVADELIEALSELRLLFPDWRVGQLVANLVMAAGGTDAGAIWDMEDEPLLAAARRLIDRNRGREASSAEPDAAPDRGGM